MDVLPLAQPLVILWKQSDIWNKNWGGDSGPLKSAWGGGHEGTPSRESFLAGSEKWGNLGLKWTLKKDCWVEAEGWVLTGASTHPQVHSLVNLSPLMAVQHPSL